MSQFTIYRGEKREIEISLSSEGSPFDLTGWDVDFIAVRGAESIAKAVGTGIEVDDPLTGVITVALTEIDTQKEAGPWDVEIRISDAGSVVTVFEGTMVIRPSLFEVV